MAFPNENQKIFMVTGKGGVGKSSVAAAMAESEARKGRRVLLVELGDQSYFQHVYRKPISYQPIEIKKNFSIALWNGKECLREYVLYLIRVRAIVDMFFNNRVMSTFIRAAPALKELAMLGKITSGIRKWGPPLEYDVIVVDAFATGHFLALMRAPIGMSTLIQTGPMGEQSRSIQRVLKQMNLCSYFIVTLAEELPVTEAVELYADLEVLTEQKPQVICNRVYEAPLKLVELNKFITTDRANGSKQFSQFLVNLLERQQAQFTELHQGVGEFKKLPLILSSKGEEVILALSKRCEGAL